MSSRDYDKDRQKERSSRRHRNYGSRNGIRNWDAEDWDSVPDPQTNTSSSKRASFHEDSERDSHPVPRSCSSRTVGHDRERDTLSTIQTQSSHHNSSGSTSRQCSNSDRHSQTRSRSRSPGPSRNFTRSTSSDYTNTPQPAQTRRPTTSASTRMSGQSSDHNNATPERQSVSRNSGRQGQPHHAHSHEKDNDRLTSRPSKRKPSPSDYDDIIPPDKIKKEKPPPEDNEMSSIRHQEQPSSVPVSSANPVIEIMLPDFGNVKLEPVQPSRNSLPLPKKPCIPHYSSHDAQEEVEYIKPRFQPIPDHKSDEEDLTDDEENFNGVSAHLSTTERFIRGQNGIKFKAKDVFKHFNFKKYKYEDQTKRLGVYKNKAAILELIEKNRVVVIEGYTGCGKTTQIPQFILDSFEQKSKPCNIVVTQPRRLAATTVAKRVTDERCWEVGDIVGYQVGRESPKSKKGITMLTYMTTGVLSEKLIQRKSLREWSHVIIDEVHERDIETDLLLLVIKKILTDNKDGKEQRVKIILMSATLEAEKFAEYFPVGTEFKWKVAPVFKIEKNQNSFELETVYMDKFINSDSDPEKLTLYEEFQLDKPQILEEIYDLAVVILDKLDEMERVKGIDPRVKGAVLIFLPGRQEIKELHQLLETRAQANRNDGIQSGDWTILDLHSGISWPEQQLVFQTPKNYGRKIILSTNVAESSITVPDVVYVIDFCLTKRMAIDNTTNFGCLTLTWASRSQCIQRAGRAGRVRSGTVFRLIPHNFFGELGSEPPPEMKECGLESVILRIKAIELGSPKEMLSLAIDPPLLSSIERAVVNLKEAGALTILKTVPCPSEKDSKTTIQVYDTADGDMTFIGKVMVKLPIDPQCARLIIFGHVFGVLNEAVIIAASLSGKRPFNSKKSDLQTYGCKIEISNKTHSDLIAFLYLYNEWIAKFDIFELQKDQEQIHLLYRRQKQWAKDNNADISVLMDIKANVLDIQNRLKNSDIIIEDVGILKDETEEIKPGLPERMKKYSKEQLLMLKIAIAGAFYPNYFYRDKPKNEKLIYDYECSKSIHDRDLFNTVYYKGFRSSGEDKTKELYAKAIADQFDGGELPPRIYFKDSLVIVTFDPILNRNGPFNYSMYKAIKRRQLRQRIKLSLLGAELEKDYYHRLSSKLEQERKRGIPCPKQVPLPGIDCTSVYVDIKCVVNPSKFYITFSCHSAPLLQMEDTIKKYMGPLSAAQFHGEEDNVPGNLCLAPFGGKYCRGEILCRPDGTGQLYVFFIDYGKTELIEYCNLIKLSKELIEKEIHKKPAMAVECRLSELKYSSLHDIFWDVDTIKQFETKAKQFPRLRIQIYSIIKSVINGELIGEEIINGETKSVNLNDYLKDANLAIKIPENKFSKMNNATREQYAFDIKKGRLPMPQSEVECYNRLQITSIPRFIEYLDYEPPARMQLPVDLKGPWSPLEITFKSLCQSSLQKEVQIDSSSVNSVTLDPQPTAPTSRLIIAASVSISDNKSKVVARETTMMPPIPGLLGFVAMIFAPKVELRVGRYWENYIGLICGLGTEPGTDTPIYLDHDMEVPFDCIVSEDDIHCVNEIRYYMNVILHQKFQNNTTGMLKEFHGRVVDNITWLLTQTRQPLDGELDNGFSWNKIPSERIIPYSKLQSDPEQIYEYHSTVKLQPKIIRKNKYDGCI